MTKAFVADDVTVRKRFCQCKVCKYWSSWDVFTLGLPVALPQAGYCNTGTTKGSCDNDLVIMAWVAPICTILVAHSHCSGVSRGIPEVIVCHGMCDMLPEPFLYPSYLCGTCFSHFWASASKPAVGGLIFWHTLLLHMGCVSFTFLNFTVVKCFFTFRIFFENTLQGACL